MEQMKLNDLQGPFHLKLFHEKLHNGEALLLPSQGNKLKAQLQEKLILQFLHIDFYLCHCSLPDNGVSPCSEQSCFLQIPEAASHAWL